jgi:DNA-binding IclR family transcriptional regulator
MITNEIGSNAAKVWRLLNEQGEQSLKELIKKLELSERDMFGAIRGLAREDKIYQLDNGDEWLISLKN